MQKMNGRFFSGRKIVAAYLNGKSNFKRSGKEETEEQEDGDEKERLDEFAKWLEEGGDRPQTQRSGSGTSDG
jgi:HIV Tat-specific factor 1